MHFRPVFVAWRPSFALLLDYRTFYQSKFDEHFLLFGSQLPESPFGVIRVPEQSLLHCPVDEVVGRADGIRLDEYDYQHHDRYDRCRILGEVGIESPQQEPDDCGTDYQ